MADKNIHEGDEVQWNWGNGHPTGTVAEIQEEGKLEIETKGKQVHKNASPENPAVHVERKGNDVVKRMSELEKTGDGGNEGVEDAKDETHAEEPAKGKKTTGKRTKQTARKSGGAPKKNKKAEKKKSEPNVEKGDKNKPERTKEGDEAEVGEKRERPSDIEEGSGVPAEREEVDKEDGKEAKKPRLSESETEEDVDDVPATKKARPVKATAKLRGGMTDAGANKKKVRAAKTKAPKTGAVEASEEEMEDVEGATAMAIN